MAERLILASASAARARLLEAAGITMGFDTLKDRATTGVHVHKASAKDRATLTSVGWTIISKLAHAGYSPEASAHAIRECRGAGQTPTYRWAKDFVRESALPGGGSTGSAKFTDTKLLKAVTDVAAHHQAAQAGQWAPSAMSRLALQLLGEMISGERTVVDWDNELRDLIAAEDGG